MESLEAEAEAAGLGGRLPGDRTDDSRAASRVPRSDRAAEGRGREIRIDEAAPVADPDEEADGRRVIPKPGAKTPTARRTVGDAEHRPRPEGVSEGRPLSDPTIGLLRRAEVPVGLGVSAAEARCVSEAAPGVGGEEGVAPASSEGVRGEVEARRFGEAARHPRGPAEGAEGVRLPFGVADATVRAVRRAEVREGAADVSREPPRRSPSPEGEGDPLGVAPRAIRGEGPPGGGERRPRVAQGTRREGASEGGVDRALRVARAPGERLGLGVGARGRREPPRATKRMAPREGLCVSSTRTIRHDAMIDRSLARILFAAVSVRLLHASFAVAAPFARSPIVDAAVYLDWGRRLAAGVDPFAGEVYWQAPLYPYALAGLFRLAGFAPAAALALQALLGAATVAATTLFARRVVGGRAAEAAGWCAALFGPLLYFEGEYLPATLATAFAAAGLLAASFEGVAAAALAGLAFGLGGAAFPFVLVGAPAAAVSAARRGGFRRGAAVLLAAAIPLAPIAVRNLRESGEAALSSNAAMNFYLGNSPDDAKVSIRPGVRWRRLAEIAHDRMPGRAGAFWIRSAAEEIAARPGDFLLGLGRKAAEFWNGHERMRNTDPYDARRFSPVLAALLWEAGLSFPFGAIAPLALLGLPRLARRPGGGVAAAYALGVCLLCVAFFVTARYRLVAVPALLVAAAEGARVLREALSARRPRTLAAGAALLALAHLPGAGLRLNDPWTALYHEALSDLAAGDPARATIMFEKAKTLSPEAPEPWFELARLHRLFGRPAEAEAAYRGGLERFDETAEGWSELGDLLAAEGRAEEAEACRRRAVERCRTFPPARLHLSAAALARGDSAAAAEEARAGLAGGPPPATERALRAALAAAENTPPPGPLAAPGGGR